jgi:hypothetical protein
VRPYHKNNQRKKGWGHGSSGTLSSNLILEKKRRFFLCWDMTRWGSNGFWGSSPSTKKQNQARKKKNTEVKENFLEL